MVKIRTASMEHMSSVLERLGEHADVESHIVLETPWERHTLQPPGAAGPPTRHEGWSEDR